MNISEKLKQDSLSLSELTSIAKSAKVHVNWLGSRNVTVDGFEGSTYIKCLTDVYLNFVEQNGRSSAMPKDPLPDFSLKDRLAGLDFVAEAERLIDEGNAAIESSNFFTRILAVVQRALGLFSYYGTDGFFMMLDCMFNLSFTDSTFLLFTKEQFESDFPGEDFVCGDSFINAEEEFEKGHRAPLLESWFRENAIQEWEKTTAL